MSFIDLSPLEAVPDTQAPPAKRATPAAARSAAPAAAPPATRPSRGRSRTLRWAALALFALCAMIVVVRMLRTEPIAVQGMAVSRGPLTVSITEDGRTRIRDRYQISSPIAGLLRRSHLKAGDRVRRGAVVGYIQPLVPALLDVRTREETRASYAAALAGIAEAEANVSSARTAAEVAQRDAQRLWALLEGGAVSIQTMEQATATARMRAADLARAEAALEAARGEASRRAALARSGAAGSGPTDLMEVRSPADGKILRLLVESEGVVQAGAPLMEVGDPGHLELVIDVLSTDAVTIPAAAPVVIDRWGGPETLHGRVDRIEPAAFTSLSSLGVEEQRVNVIATLDETASRPQLGDGYQVEARIVTWQSPASLRVIAGALLRHEGGWAVYLIRGGRARLTPVTIGRSDGKLVEVLDGVREGDIVIAYPGDNILEGSPVKAE